MDTNNQVAFYKFIAIAIAVLLFAAGFLIGYYQVIVKGCIALLAGVIELLLSKRTPKLTNWLQVIGLAMLAFYIIDDVLINVLNNHIL